MGQLALCFGIARDTERHYRSHIDILKSLVRARTVVARGQHYNYPPYLAEVTFLRPFDNDPELNNKNVMNLHSHLKTAND